MAGNLTEMQQTATDLGREVTTKNAVAPPLRACSRTQIPDLILWGALLVIVALAVRSLSGWPARIALYGDEEATTAPPYAEIVSFARGVNLYADVPGEFHAAIYGPLYYVLGRSLTNPSAPSPVPLRLISVVGWLIAIGAIASIAYKASGKWLAAVVGVGLFGGMAIVRIAATSLRCDVFAYGMSITAFALAYHFRDKRLTPYACAPLFAVSLLYKQQFLAAPAAVFFALLWTRRFSQAAKFAVALAVFLTAAILLLQSGVFHGQNFIEHFLFYNLGLFEWRKAALWLGVTVLIYGAPALAAGDFLKRHPDPYLLFYLVIAMVSAGLACGKSGSSTIYYLETGAIISLLLGCATADSLVRKRNQMEVAAILVFVGLITAMPWLPRSETSQNSAAWQLVQQLRTKARGKVAFGVLPADFLRAGLHVPITDAFQFGQLVRRGSVSEANFLHSIERREYGIIVIDCELGSGRCSDGPGAYLSPQAVAEIAANYFFDSSLELPPAVKSNTFQKAYVWLPKKNSIESATP